MTWVMFGGNMKRILDNKLLHSYISKFNIEKIFDKEILEHVQLYFFEKGEFILEAEANLDYYYLLVDGKIKISYPFENGKSMLLKFYKDVIPIGDIELLKNIPVICDVESVEDTYLLAISSDVLRNKFLDNPRFLHHLVNSLSEKLYATINNSSYNYIYPLENRLASYLVEHIGEENHIVLDSSFKDIAQFLGTTYRHLNRTFKEFEDKRIIKVESKSIFILDEEKLLDLSKNLYMTSL